jgi:hypothetical protein
VLETAETSGGAAALHAKAAIADDHTALVASANLTGHGIGENMAVAWWSRSLEPRPPDSG